MEGVPGPSAVIEPRDLRFHVKIVFKVTEIFVFCIQAKVTYCCLLAFAQWHGVISTEILGKGGGVGAPKRGAGGKAPQFKIYFAVFEQG